MKLPNQRVKVQCKRFLSALLFPVFFDKNAMLRIFELCIQGNRKQSLMLKESIHISFSQLHLFLRNQPQTFQQHFTIFLQKVEECFKKCIFYVNNNCGNISWFELSSTAKLETPRKRNDSCYTYIFLDDILSWWMSVSCWAHTFIQSM